jgi:hypothetical protein
MEEYTDMCTYIVYAYIDWTGNSLRALTILSYVLNLHIAV